MKKQFLLIAALLCTMFTNAQTLEDMKNSETMTWYGIDFTVAKLQNFGSFMTDNSVKFGLPRWTMHPFGEDDLKKFKGKYDKKTIVIFDAQAAKRNKERDYAAQMTTEAYELNMDSLQNVVSQYEMKGTGYGLMYIVESFEYRKKKSNVWVVYINEADKKIIDARKVTKETYGDWFEGIIEATQQGGKYKSSK